MVADAVDEKAMMFEEVLSKMSSTWDSWSKRKAFKVLLQYNDEKGFPVTYTLTSPEVSMAVGDIYARFVEKSLDGIGSGSSSGACIMLKGYFEVSREYAGNIIRTFDIHVLNSLGKEVAGVTHVDFNELQDVTEGKDRDLYQVQMKGVLVFDEDSGEVLSIRDRLFPSGDMKFGIKFRDKVIWWFENPDEIIGPSGLHVNTKVQDWIPESAVELVRCERTIEKLS